MKRAFRVERRTPPSGAAKAHGIWWSGAGNADLVRRMLRALNGDDVDAVLVTFTDGVQAFLTREEGVAAAGSRREGPA